ncbi:unnamed protein product, partial [marine sediment metagenome]
NTGEDIIKAYYRQEELITRAKDAKFKRSMKSFCENAPLHKSKFTKRSMTKTVEYKVNKVSSVAEEKEAGGWDMTDYKCDVDKLVIEEEEESKTAPEEESKEGYDSEFERLTKRMFPQWSRPDNDSKIARFMKNLDPYKLYTIEELKQYSLSVGIDFRITHFVNNKIGKSNGFGEIILKVGDKYKLRNELVDKYLEYFN